MMRSIFKTTLTTLVQRQTGNTEAGALVANVFDAVASLGGSTSPPVIPECDVSIADAAWDTITDLRVPDCRHFIAAKLNDDKCFVVVFKDVDKQVYRTTTEANARQVAADWEKLFEVATEAYLDKKLDQLLSKAIAHPLWADFQCAATCNLADFIDNFLAKKSEAEKHSILAALTPDTKETVLNVAVKYRSTEFAASLFQHGADPGLKSGSLQRNAFHIAAAGAPEILGLLLANSKFHEAALFQTDSTGAVPLSVAIDAGNLAGVKTLMAYYDTPGLARLVSIDNGPLHRAAKNSVGLEIIDFLLIKQPGLLDERDTAGDTPLLWQVRRGHTETVLRLIAFGADLTEVDAFGRSLLDVATERGHTELVQLILALSGRPPINPPSFAVARQDIRELYEALSQAPPPRNQSLLLQIRGKLLADRQKSFDSTRLRLLALDGGGIRGICSALILHILEVKIQAETGNKKLKIGQSFDWLAGTSTGAIITLALCQGKRTALDVVRLYLRFAQTVFHGVRPYDASRLETLLKDEFGSTTKIMDILDGGEKKKFFITTVKALQVPAELILIRNYDIQGEEPTSDNLVWKSLRCSSAAPLYFNSVDNTYLDGGLISNNPSSDLFVDVAKINQMLLCSDQAPLSIGCCLNVGTGAPKPIYTNAASVTYPSLPRNLSDFRPMDLIEKCNQVKNVFSFGKMFVDQVCASGGPVADRAAVTSQAQGAPFYRLSPQLLTEVDLDDARPSTIIGLLWAARLFCEVTAGEDINELVLYLSMWHEA